MLTTILICIVVLAIASLTFYAIQQLGKERLGHTDARTRPIKETEEVDKQD